MSSLLQMLAAGIIRHRIAIPALALVLIGALAVPIATIRTDNNVRAWFEPDDPAQRRYDLLLDTFGGDEYVIVAFPVANAFAPDVLQRIDQLTRRVLALDNVDRVDSLTDIENIRGDANGDVHVGPLIDGLPVSDEALAQARRELAVNPLLRRTVVSTDATSAAVITRLLPLRNEESRHRIVQEIRGIAEEVLVGQPFYLMGQPVFDEAFFRVSEHDLALLVPVILVVMAAILWWFFRALTAVILPLAMVGLSTVTTMGILALTGTTTNVLVSAVPLVLLVVGLAASVHFLCRYREELSVTPDRHTALRNAFVDLAAPALSAGVTTAVGFASFATSDIPPVRNFGLYSGIGVLVSYVLSLTVLPAALAMLPALPPLATREDGTSTKFWDRVASLALRGRGLILVANGVIIVVSLIGLSRVRVNDNWLHYFRAGAEVPSAVEYVEDHFNGVGTLETVFVGKPDAMQDPALLARIDAYAAFLTAMPTTDRVTGPADFVKRVNQVINDNQAEYHRLPHTPEAVAQLLLLIESSEVKRFLTPDRSKARVSAHVKFGSSQEFRTVVSQAEAYLQEHFPTLETVVTGNAELNARVQDNIVASQTWSLATSAVLIFPLIAVLAGSLRFLPLILVACLQPLAVTFGFMGFAGIDLNAGTVLVAAISLGLVDDYTVHCISRLRSEMERGGTLGNIVADSLRHVGPAMLYTSILTVGGFALLGLADFRPFAHQGLLTAMAIGVAFVVDVLILPAMLSCLPGTLGTAGAASAVVAKHEPHVGEAVGHGMI